MVEREENCKRNQHNSFCWKWMKNALQVEDDNERGVWNKVDHAEKVYYFIVLDRLFNYYLDVPRSGFVYFLFLFTLTFCICCETNENKRERHFRLCWDAETGHNDRSNLKTLLCWESSNWCALKKYFSR
jgi:hypothetical protein